MHDRNDTPLKVGDCVLIEGVISNLSESTPDYCNVTVQSVVGRKPDGLQETLCINTNVLALMSREEK